LLKRILQEPLLHFLVVGSLLFIYLSNNDTTTSPQIVITKGKVEQLTAQFTKTRQREPSKEELKALIDNQIKENLAFTHGVNMGLLEDDSIIKRRVQQKIEFMLNDSIAAIEPSTKELQAYLDKHKDRYTISPIYSFRHIYINPDKHQDIDNFIAELKNKDLDNLYGELGDSMMIDNQFKSATTAQIARVLGEKFAKKLDTLPLHSWQSHIKSGYGEHLVIIDKKTPSHIATLEEINRVLRRDFRVDAQKRALEEFYKELKSQYIIKVEESK